jgi:hypothetical protein
MPAVGGLFLVICHLLRDIKQVSLLLTKYPICACLICVDRQKDVKCTNVQIYCKFFHALPFRNQKILIACNNVLGYLLIFHTVWVSP